MIELYPTELLLLICLGVTVIIMAGVLARCRKRGQALKALQEKHHHLYRNHEESKEGLFKVKTVLVRLPCEYDPRKSITDNAARVLWEQQEIIGLLDRLITNEASSKWSPK